VVSMVRTRLSAHPQLSVIEALTFMTLVRMLKRMSRHEQDPLLRRIEDREI
jgi:hypothetical protein